MPFRGSSSLHSPFSGSVFLLSRRLCRVGSTSSCFATRVAIGPAGTVLWPHPCLMPIQLVPCHLPAIRREVFCSSVWLRLFSAAPVWLTPFTTLHGRLLP